MKKYGLQLRVPPAQQKKQAGRPPLPPPAGFRDDDDEEETERAVSRQTIKTRAIKEIEEQHKKMLEEDPTIFDYDGVYDEMKQDIVRPRAQDREERKPKYILNLKKKAEERQKEHEIVFERKLAKERTKEDHLYADKDKFVTSAYKKKLAEQAKWMEEERLRQLREEKEDVTKKSDLTDFYFNLGKNVAYGARSINVSRPEKHPESRKPEKHDEMTASTLEGSPSEDRSPKPASARRPEEDRGPKPASPRRPEEGNKADIPSSSRSEVIDAKRPPDFPVLEKEGSVEPSPADEPKRDHHKRGEDAVAAAKERFLARKKAKDQ